MHDLFVTYEAMTPAEYKRKGEGLTIQYGTHETLFGDAFIATTQRAVGSAIGANNIAYLILCHLVIQKVGTTGNYRWGEYRKKAILGWEGAKVE